MKFFREKIHREGKTIILTTLAIVIAITILLALFLPKFIVWIAFGVGVLIVFFIMRFFRTPERILSSEKNCIVSPADGEVVVVEQVFEDEYLKCEALQISVFMSVWNVHVNWFPVSGNVEYFKHHNGNFHVAWHPKSSTDNERTTIVVNDGKNKILFRQVAGLVARRIVSYVEVGNSVKKGEQCGFIKFGSRMDIFVPLESNVNVKLGDKVKGCESVIAYLPKK